MQLAYAHGTDVHAAGPVLITLADWAFDPIFLLPLLLALLYLRGYARYRRRGGRRFGLWRVLLFALGVAVVAIALMSPVDALADVSFTWHMAQHDLLMLVAIPLVMLGAPFIPVVRGLPLAVRRRLFIPFARQGVVRAAARWLTQPVVALFLFECTVLAWHVPGFYDAALRSEAIHYGMHLSFLFTGVLFWWNLVTPYPFPSRLHPLLRVLMLFGSSIVNGFLSAIIVFSDQVLYDYRFLGGFWGLDSLTDQEIGSALMWVVGSMMRLTAISLIFLTYAMKENAREPGVRLALERERARALGRDAPQGA